MHERMIPDNTVKLIVQARQGVQFFFHIYTDSVMLHCPAISNSNNYANTLISNGVK